MPSGLRERKKQKTRVALEATAFGLFEQHGYEATTVEEIAEASDVSPRTFFRYFGSKNEVVFGQHPEHLEVLRQLVRERVVDDRHLCKLFDAVVAFAEHLEARRDDVLPRAQLVAANASLQSRSLQVQRAWEEQLAKELADLVGRAHPDLDVRVLVGAAMTALCVGIRSWQLAHATEPLHVVVRRTIEALHSSLEGPGTGRGSRTATRNAPSR